MLHAGNREKVGWLAQFATNLPSKKVVEDAVGVVAVIGRQHARDVGAVPQPRRLVHLRERLHEDVVLHSTIQHLQVETKVVY